MELFRAMGATWPSAATRMQGPWTIREGRGAGSRASAATLDGPLGDPLGDPAEAAAAMRALGQRPLFQVRPGEDVLDAALAALGYRIEDPSLILSAPAAALALPVVDGRAMLCDGPLAVLGDLWDAGGIGPARREIMMRARGPRAWLLGRAGDRPAAAGFVAADGGIALLHALWVAPSGRRHGLGALLTRAAATWARDGGCETFALAVKESNAPARALYAALGLTEAARYHYRVAPDSAEGELQ